jgi:hypothetical protein
MDESVEIKKYTKALTTEPTDDTILQDNIYKSSLTSPRVPNIFSKNTVFVFGNDIRIKSPFRVGNTFSFCYINRKPLFMIGPNCI